MADKHITTTHMVVETKRLLENIGAGPVEVEFIISALDGQFVLKANNSRKVAWVTMERFNLAHDLSELSKRFLEPAAQRLASELNV